MNSHMRYPNKESIKLATGEFFWTFDPDSSAKYLDERSIAWGLAHQSVGRGQNFDRRASRPIFYSIGERCIRASDIAEPEFKYAVLMSRVAAVIWGEMPDGQKLLVPDFTRHERHCQRALCRRFDVTITASALDEIERTTRIIRATEQRDIEAASSIVWPDLENVEPLHERIVPTLSRIVAMRFMTRMRELRPQRQQAMEPVS